MAQQLQRQPFNRTPARVFSRGLGVPGLFPVPVTGGRVSRRSFALRYTERVTWDGIAGEAAPPLFSVAVTNGRVYQRNTAAARRYPARVTWTSIAGVARSVLALSAATVFIADSALTTGTLLPAAETPLGTSSGCTFPGSPAGMVVLRVVTTAQGGGAVTFKTTDGSPAPSVAMTNSATYLFGPFDPARYATATGTIEADFSITTGISVGVYLIPAYAPLATMRRLHDPFQMTAGAQTS